jgi:hypothetical protein
MGIVAELAMVVHALDPCRYNGPAMPTIYREGPYRFFFNSREEPRRHVHVQSPDGMAKFWLDPIVALALSHGLEERELRRIEAIVKEHADEFSTAWRSHFRQ